MFPAEDAGNSWKIPADFAFPAGNIDAIILSTANHRIVFFVSFVNFVVRIFLPRGTQGFHEDHKVIGVAWSIIIRSPGAGNGSVDAFCIEIRVIFGDFEDFDNDFIEIFEDFIVKSVNTTGKCAKILRKCSKCQGIGFLHVARCTLHVAL